MILWFFVIVASYFFFSVSVFGDKLLLAGKPNPKSYTFYVGILNSSVLLLLFFVPMGLPSLSVIFWAILSGLATILALYFMFCAVEQFEVSRVMPALGGLQPIFVFLLTDIFFGWQTVTLTGFFAFVALIAGSVLISVEKSLSLEPTYVKLVTGSALLFSLSYVFSKMVFLGMPFLSGLILMGAATACIASSLLLGAGFRRAIFGKHAAFDRKNGVVFLSFQLSGAAAGFLQNWAIALVPVGFLAIMNSLRGIQYIFLFAITLFFSLFLPHIFTEKISPGIILKKSLSILLIGLGLILLVI